MTEEDLTFSLLRGLPPPYNAFYASTSPLLDSLTFDDVVSNLRTYESHLLRQAEEHKPTSLHLVQTSHNYKIRILITTEEGDPIEDKDAIKAKINLAVSCVSNMVTRQSIAMNASTKTLYSLSGIQEIRIATLEHHLVIDVAFYAVVKTHKRRSKKFIIPNSQ